MELKTQPIRKQVSLFGSGYNMFIKHVNQFQSHNLKQLCSLSCPRNNTIGKEESSGIYFSSKDNHVSLNSVLLGKCKECKSNIKVEIKFLYDPNFIVIEPLNSDLTVSQIPKQYIIDNKVYSFCFSTVLRNDHFFGVFDLYDKMYVVNDLDQSVNPYIEERRRSNQPDVCIYARV